MPPHPPETVLIVDDDPEIRQLLGHFLEAAGLRPALASDGLEMRQRLQESRVDLVVLDVMRPGEGGLDLLRWLREHTQLPVIMVTALNSPIDRVVGLEIGADDYVSKPFEPRELLARIRAVLRRAAARLPGSPPALLKAPVRFRFGAWSLDSGSHALRHQDGVLVPLSGSEYRLLCVFLTHPRVVLSREPLVELAHNRDLQREDRTIDIQVYRLRQRLRDTGEILLLKTVRNSGYLLNADVHTVPPDA